MKRLGFNLIALVGCFVVGLLAASALNFIQLSQKSIQRTDMLATKLPATQFVLPGSEIRRIDFLNFVYPIQDPDFAGIQNTIKLVDGKSKFDNTQEEFWSEVEITSGDITYTDLTGDGKEEAIVDVSPHYSKFGISRFVYIYTLEGEHTKLLWFFSPGWGGRMGNMKRMYAQNGDLIVEFYGKTKVSDKAINIVTDIVDDEHRCDRCYEEFTRARFSWNGERFEQKGTAEIYPLTDNQD